MVRGLNAYLQDFSDEQVADHRTSVAGFLARIAGWYGRLRIYSCGSFGYFGVPVEEFNEAYLSAKSSQESENARLSQADEYGGRPQGHR